MTRPPRPGSTLTPLIDWALCPRARSRLWFLPDRPAFFRPDWSNQWDLRRERLRLSTTIQAIQELFAQQVEP